MSFAGVGKTEEKQVSEWGIKSSALNILCLIYFREPSRDVK